MDVVMPQMGESVAEGTITKWLKQVGDQIKRDEPLFEISTDKVDAEIPSPAAGQLAEIVHGEGETVEVNTIVARLASAEPAVDGDGADVVAAAGAPAGAPAGPVAAGTPTDGAAATVSPTAPATTPAVPASPAVASAAGVATIPAPSPDASREDMRRLRSSPLVRRIAAEHGVDLSLVPGTGSSNRVTKQDILDFVARGGTAATVPAGAAPAMPATGVPSAAPAPPGAPTPAIAFAPGAETHVEPMSVMRQKIAEHMVMSRRTSAHVTTVFEVDYTAIETLRRRHKERFRAENGVNLSVTAFIARATVDALRAFPIANARLDGNDIVFNRHINLGVAVALDWGLLVPVIHRAEEKNLVGIARGITDLATRARGKKLNPDEVQGGTFSITNPGVFGSLFGTPIINQPQVAILGVGTIVKRPTVITAADGSDSIAIRSIGYLVLSFDHRLLDGAIADQFVAHIKQTLEAARFPELV